MKNFKTLRQLGEHVPSPLSPDDSHFSPYQHCPCFSVNTSQLPPLRGCPLMESPPQPTAAWPCGESAHMTLKLHKLSTSLVVPT